MGAFGAASEALATDFLTTCDSSPCRNYESATGRGKASFAAQHTQDDPHAR